MSSNNNDFFGGLFDFNGDGKTSIDEEFLAYKIFEETTKEESDDENEDDFIPTYHTAPKAAPIITPTPVQQSKISVPETLTKENYPQRKNALKSGILVSILTGLFLSILPIVVMWATIASYDDKNSA